MDNTLIADVKHILVRDLHAMAGEVADTPDEHLWEALPGVINPVGTLALHVCGNLRHFIGALLGDNGRPPERSHAGTATTASGSDNRLFSGPAMLSYTSASGSAQLSAPHQKRHLITP
jgi:hypothetical protein